MSHNGKRFTADEMKPVNINIDHYTKVLHQQGATEEDMPKYAAYFDVDQKKRYGTETWETADGVSLDCTSVYDVTAPFTAPKTASYLGFVVKYVGCSEKRKRLVEEGKLNALPHGYRDPSDTMATLR